MARKVEGGPAVPVCIVENRAGGSSTDTEVLEQVQAISTNVADIETAISAMAEQLPVAVEASASDHHGPAANTAAVVTYNQNIAGLHHVITGVAWSYSDDPTGGKLTITGSTTGIVFEHEITTGGPGYFAFPVPKQFDVETVTITLAAGGAGITGKVSVLNHWLV